jgi:hypothetical protein
MRRDSHRVEAGGEVGAERHPSGRARRSESMGNADIVAAVIGRHRESELNELHQEAAPRRSRRARQIQGTMRRQIWLRQRSRRAYPDRSMLPLTHTIFA